MKKDQNLSIKKSEAILVQGNDLHLAKVISDHNRHIQTIFADDLHVGKIHKTFHKVVIADRTARLTNIRIITQDPNQIEVITPSIIQTVQIQILLR